MNNKNIKLYLELTSDLETSWIDLWNKSDHAHFFNSLGFFKTCLNVYGINDYIVVTYWQKKSLVGVLPLLKRKRYGINSYSLPGGKFMEKSMMLIKDNSPKIIKEMIDAILISDNFFLSETEFIVSKDMLNYYRNSLAATISHSLYIDLEKNPFEALSKKNFNKIKNRITKNNKYLKHEHIQIIDNVILNLIFEIEQKSTKKLSGKEIFSKEINRSYFKSLVKQNPGIIVADLIYYKREPFVYSLGILSKHDYIALHTAFLSEYKWIMPGKVLLFYMLPFYKNLGIKIFNFGRGDTNFKHEFTSKYVAQYDLYLSKHLIPIIWWRLINYIRRLRIIILKTLNSKDSEFLFRPLNYDK